MAQDDGNSINNGNMATTGQSAGSQVSEGRRKAIKAGLIGAPLLLTLRSGPAWGQTEAAVVSGHSATSTGQTTSRLDPQPTDDQGIDG